MAEVGRPGRLRELSPEVRSLILAEIRRGVSPVNAAALAEIPPSTFFDWMRWGKDPDREPYAGFRSAVKFAERAWTADQEAAIGSSPDWRARTWLLERRRRAEYAPPKAEVGVSGSIGVNVSLDAVSDEALARIALGKAAEAGRTDAG